MSEKIWYFAQGDSEQGPLTESRIRSMATSGVLRPDDLVWREGMKQWVPAREVPELFQAPPEANDEGATATDLPVPSQALRPRQTVQGRRPIELFGRARLVAQPLMILGLVLVLLARGCDSIHARYVERVQAIAEVAEGAFKDKWNSEVKSVQRELGELQSKPTPTVTDSRRIRELNQQLVDIQRRYTKQQNDLRNGKWQQQQSAARAADASYKMWGWLRESVFLFGTIGLTLGLLAVGFSGSGAERWICLIMIAIITFSIYVGGIAWLSRLPKL